MKALIQRVSKASVVVNNATISAIGRGLCVFIGIHKNDDQSDIDYLIRKILNIRLFEDEDGRRWQKSLKDSSLEILCISQFTLYCDVKGNKPDYRHNKGGEEAKEFYRHFIESLEKQYNKSLIKDGIFGAKMDVHLINDGPVTISLESKKPEGK